jgi:hypothetical protein
MSSLNLSQQTHNSLLFINQGLNNASPWTVSINNISGSNINIVTPKKSNYPNIPLINKNPTTLSYVDLANYLNSLSIDKNLKIAILAKSINEQGKGTYLSGYNNNYFGIQTDSGNWGSIGDQYITGRFIASDSKTTREFASFNNWKGGVQLAINKIQKFGLYIGGIPYRFKDNPYYNMLLTDVTGWANSYYYEWVRSSSDGVNVDPITINFVNSLINIYSQAQSLIK